jgi:tetratricopeptide (TPR) repeat protein
MKKSANLILGVLALILVALGAVQGHRVTKIRDADRFYRWIASAATQVRLHGSLTSGVAPDPSAPEPMDEQLWQRITQKADEILPPLPDEDAEALQFSRVVQYAIPSETLVPRAGVEGEYYTPDLTESRKRLSALWHMAASNELAEEREDFFNYSRNNQLVSMGTQFSLGNLYEGEDTMVSLGNLFFGFRKMAANLLWLEADKNWHAGLYYKMIPIMKTTVALDPSFVDAFLVGAWHLAYNATAGLDDTPIPVRQYVPEYGERVGEKEAMYYRAVEFLKDGARKNPSNYKIYFDLGFSTYYEKLNDYANAVKYLTEAMRRQHDRWVPRMLYLSMTKNGQYEDALVGYYDYEEKHPGNPNVPRLIETNKAMIHQTASEEASDALIAARDEAASLREQAGVFRADGEEATARSLEEQAADLERKADALLQTANAEREKARTIWQELVSNEEDDFAEGNLIRMQVTELLEQGRTIEARAMLDYARSQTDQLFHEFSEWIIDIKLKEGVQLNRSEQMALERRHLREAVEDRVIADRVFEFRDDGWYQMEYRGQTPDKAFRPGQPVPPALDGVEGLDDILALARMNNQYPDLDGILHLGDRVCFQVGDQWFLYQDPDA